MRYLKQLLFITFISILPIIIAGCGGGGGGGNSNQAEPTSTFDNPLPTNEPNRTITEPQTGAKLIVPEDTTIGKDGIKLQNTEVPVSSSPNREGIVQISSVGFPDTIESAGPAFNIQFPQGANGEFTLEIEANNPSIKRIAHKDIAEVDTENIELFYFDESTSEWFPLPTVYNASENKLVSYFDFLDTTGTKSVKVAYGLTDFKLKEKRCISTSGVFNGYYCQCPNESYWGNDVVGCVPVSSARKVNEITQYSNHSFLTANVGNASTYCKNDNYKLCFLSTEERIRNDIDWYMPDIVFLQEVITAKDCDATDNDSRKSCSKELAGSKQKDRLLDTRKYISFCNDFVLSGNSGYGYECIGIKKDKFTIKKRFVINANCSSDTGSYA